MKADRFIAFLLCMMLVVSLLQAASEQTWRHPQALYVCQIYKITNN